MEMIILAGGIGSRLASIVSDVPKPMANINGKPFLEWLLNWAIEQGVSHFFFAVSHMRDIISDHFGDAYCGTQIDYSIEHSALGTGGAIKQALQMTKEEQVLVVNGDTLFQVDLNKLLESHFKNRNDITIAVRPVQDTNRYGCIELSGQKIVNIREKGIEGPGLINGGIYCINRNLLDSIDAEKFSFEKEILECRLHQLNIGAIVEDKYFIDIGIPADYLRAQEEFKW